MDRREFSLAAAAAALLPLAATAQVKPPEDGREYRTLDKRAPVDAPAGRIELVDFFWYNCPHCNAFEPMLQAWSRRLPDDVQMKRVPAAFHDDMVAQQRLFYTLEALGKVGELHTKVFDAVHKEHLDLTRLPGMVDWAARQGIDPAKFTDTFNSFAIAAKARRAAEIQNAYGLEGVPAFGVAGRWYTDPTLAGGNNSRFIQVAEFLLGEARKSR
jgi:thiol:disulfide interchange protein DsbA